MPMRPNIPTGAQGHNGTTVELKRRMIRRRNSYFDLLTYSVTTPYGSLCKRLGGHRCDYSHSSQELDQIRNIVGTHIKYRATP